MSEISIKKSGVISQGFLFNRRSLTLKVINHTFPTGHKMETYDRRMTTIIMAIPGRRFGISTEIDLNWSMDELFKSIEEKHGIKPKAICYGGCPINDVKEIEEKCHMTSLILVPQYDSPGESSFANVK